MFKKVNKARKAHGVPKLRGSWSLLGSATRYANRMMSWDYFGHQAHIPVASGWSAAGETLAWHRGWRLRPRRTVRMWLRSPTHRAVLMSSRYRKIGIGKSRGTYAGTRATMWVAHVARR